ncbi:rho GTPase-activating protein 4 [Aegilops tauschii subsp. strangulata]|uniref:Rho-GAP domain-containing protein n=4 Tax=Triticinae TaxID=1648030 RepID=A0A453HNP8_AEGTS|nr:rho GTPase-activating protein 5 [Aegilops tauschii subsp. strangulata]XP_044374136.1 rho GTPase-activating protein 5-like [Triticum aestivum]
MTEVALFRGPTNLASPASRGSSSSSSTSLRYLADSDVLQRGTSSSAQSPAGSAERQAGGLQEEEEEEERWSFLALLLELLRKSLLRCRAEDGGEGQGGMEIGLPTDVQHVAHVTFDRFHGFLGLPVEFEPEVPRRAPSASASVFGVSTQSMQCSYDSRGNSVPTILLMMQRRLYEQGGLRAEGIFRINAENSQEEFVRDHLNSGTVPDGIDVHCLAGLIKAWFRELPSGVLDSIPPEQVMQCQSEEDCARVAKCLPPTEAALLDWAVNLMADVVQEEQINKMSDRNVAMVFAPNMTQMADPLTALMYAVQVMNFLKMLIQKTLKDREDSNLEDASLPQKDPSDENGHQNPSLPVNPQPEETSGRPSFVSEEPLVYSPTHSAEDKPPVEGDSVASIVQRSDVRSSVEGSASCSQPALVASSAIADASCATAANLLPSRGNRGLNSRRTRKGKRQCGTPAAPPAEKSRGASIVSRINSKVERIEAWR